MEADSTSAGGSGRARTYSIWTFVALFVLLTVGGLLVLIFGGEPDQGTIKLSAPQTLPTSTSVDSSTSAAATAPTTTTTTSTTSTTVAGDLGSTPEGVAEVIVDGESTSYVFAAARDLVVDGGLPPGYTARVAPTSVTPDPDDDRRLSVRIGCAASADEVLVQVIVTESDTVIVATAVLVPDGGPPCTAGSSRVVPVTLRAPLAGRPLAVLPAGTEFGAMPGS